MTTTTATPSLRLKSDDKYIELAYADGRAANKKRKRKKSPLTLTPLIRAWEEGWEHSEQEKVAAREQAAQERRREKK